MSSRFNLTLLTTLTWLLLSTPAIGAESIINLHTYSPSFASAGQPNAEQLEQLQRDGFERVIYIAFSDHKQSLLHEDRLVKALGMDYLHIPVVWTTPSASDFALFASAMQQAPEKKTLLHCQMNYRASAFALLYRVIYQDIPLAQALADMQRVWTPTEHWVEFMQQTLKDHGKPNTCANCRWRPADAE